MVETGHQRQAPEVTPDPQQVARWRAYWLRHQREQFRQRLAMCVTALKVGRK